MPSWHKSLKKILKKVFVFKNLSEQKRLLAIFSLGRKQNSFDKQTELDHKLTQQIVNQKKSWPSLKQMKYVGQVLNALEKKRLKILTTIFALALLGLIINVYFTAPLVAKNGGSYTEGLVGLPKFVNPLYASLNQVDADLSALIYSSLVAIDKEQNIGPDLAQSWDVSDDQKVYTFIMRQDALWHDGQPVIIDDVIYTYEAIQNAEFKSPLAQNFEDVTIEVLDDKTIKFTLDEPYAPFLENLTVGILPSHIWSEVIPANALLTDYNLKPVGSGAFKFKSLTKDKLGNIKSYILARHKKYYQQPPYLDEIAFKFYPDFTTASDALKNRNIDGLSYLPKELKEGLNSRRDINYYSLQLPQLTALFFNQKNNAALKIQKVRYALARALNKQDIINQALQTEGQVIDAPILPGFIGYHPKIEKYTFDLEATAQLLDQAGYTLAEGESFRKNSNNEELEITLTTVNKGENFLAAGVIQKMWQAVGIKTQVSLIDPQFIKSETIKNRDFEVLLFGEIVGIDPDPYPFWHSSQAGEAGLNLSNFINREADKILEDARQISDPQKRHDKYVHFQNILNHYLPAIFLYTPKYLYPVTSDIQGIDTTNITAPADRFSNITNWFIKTKRSIIK